MVLGYLIATGLETAVELSVWAVSKTARGVYYWVYPPEEPEESKETTAIKEELVALRKELADIKEIIDR
jgi:hypothetical protein